MVFPIQKEEAELERLREKERIRSGKELLEAKRKEDDLKLKRNLELRRIEKEEEARAREKIRVKLGTLAQIESLIKVYMSVDCLVKVRKLHAALANIVCFPGVIMSNDMAQPIMPISAFSPYCCAIIYASVPVLAFNHSL